MVAVRHLYLTARAIGRAEAKRNQVMVEIKVKNPVEFSFTIWINTYPFTGHWADKEKFRTFVKNVCRHNAKNWKNSTYFRKRIEERLPGADAESIDYYVRLYDELIAFYYTPSILNHIEDHDSVTPGHYIQLEARKGKVVAKEKPYPEKVHCTPEELAEDLRVWRSKREGQRDE